LFKEWKNTQKQLIKFLEANNATSGKNHTKNIAVTSQYCIPKLARK